jgi:hypothetical protein
VASEEIFTLPQRIWRRWAPAILSYPLTGDTDGKIQESLIKIAYQNASDEIIETLLLLIDKENKEYSNIFIIRQIENLWDERLADSLLEKVRDTKLKPTCMGTILGYLLDHKSSGAKEFAESLVSSHNTFTGDERTKAVIAASELITRSEGAGWDTVWPAIQTDIDYSQAIIATVARDHYPMGKQLNLKESQLADLYMHLARRYPYKEDPRHEGVFTPGPRDNIANFKEFILNQLKQSGTEEACEEIKRIAKEFPELDWLNWTLYDAQIVTRQKTWKPLLPEEVIELAQRANFGTIN